MFSLIEILSILVIHWFSDFILQTDEQAKNKSKQWKPLLIHTGNYSMMFALIGSIVLPYNLMGKVLLFTLITFICHTATDYVTSRINSRLWQEKKVHAFFVSIGFDQYLHYAQLFATYYFIFKSLI